MDRRTLLTLALSLTFACADLGNGPGTGFRTAALGFTDFPYARTPSAVREVRRIVSAEGDLAVFHCDGGVPWQEAAAGTSYDASFEAELAAQRASVPAGHKVYLAVTPINLQRDGLALHRGAEPGEPLSAPFDTLGFSDSLVVRSYTAYCLRMIDLFQPDYFGYAIEANLVAKQSPAQRDALLILAESVYVAVKRAHPTLPSFSTIQLETLYGGLPANGTATTQLLAFSDVLAVSTYPYTMFPGPNAMPRDYFSELKAFAAGRPLAVAETGWPAEPIGAPYPADIYSSVEYQTGYIERMLSDFDDMDAVFVTWFFTRDYDDLWETELKNLPSAPLLRVRRDDGLFAGDGSERPALLRWRNWVARKYR